MNLYEENIINEILEEKIDEGLEVTDNEIATSIMKRLKYVNMLKEENIAIANKEIQKIKLWQDEANSELDKKIKYYEEVLLEFFKQQQELNPKYKLDTPYGKVTKRKSKKWSYDEEAVIEFLEENMYIEMINIEKSIKKNDIKKAFPEGIDKSTGQVIDGITITEEVNYNIKLL
jgi:hypothetical protein